MKLVPAPAQPSGFAAQLLQELFSTEEKLLNFVLYIISYI